MDITSVKILYQVSRRVLSEKRVFVKHISSKHISQKNNIASILNLMPANLDKHARALFVQRKLTAVKKKID